MKKQRERLLFANVNWFRRRKYLGWGVGIKTWQGGVYVAVILGLMIACSALAEVTNYYSLYGFGVLIMILLVDMGFVMISMRNDEREKLHEAIAERNAVWGMMIILVGGVVFEGIYYGLQEKIYVDPFMAGALLVGVIIKSVTNYKLDREN